MKSALKKRYPLLTHALSQLRFATVLERTRRRGPAALATHLRKRAAHGQSIRDAIDLALLVYPRAPELVALSEDTPSQPYDPTFYSRHADGARRAGRAMLQALYAVHPFDSLVDIGAGTGQWLAAAKDLGATDLLGVEGPWVENISRDTDAPYTFVDLNEPLTLPRTFDVALSVEVAEHLHPEGTAAFVDSMTQLSDVCVFGAAAPRQRGQGHINARPASAWAREFQSRGFVCLDFFRPRFWSDPTVAPWYAQNTFLYVRANRRDSFASTPEACLLDVAHPALFNGLIVQDHRDPTSS